MKKNRKTAPLRAEESHEPASCEQVNDEKKKILKARAITLSRTPDIEEAADNYLEVVAFLLAYESYAIDLSFVREIYHLKDYTPLPCTPPFVFGIINVRGQILSVIDIKKFFDLPDKGLGELNKVIILKTTDMEFGILADKIIGTRSIPLKNIQQSLPTLIDIRAEYLKGVTDESLIILDVPKIMSDKRIIIHEKVGM